MPRPKELNEFRAVRDLIDLNTSLGRLSLIDVQNIVCEFRKYMDISAGNTAGKRKYPKGGIKMSRPGRLI